MVRELGWDNNHMFEVHLRDGLLSKRKQEFYSMIDGYLFVFSFSYFFFLPFYWIFCHEPIENKRGIEAESTWHGGSGNIGYTELHGNSRKGDVSLLIEFYKQK
jgi:hypothetical protein